MRERPDAAAPEAAYRPEQLCAEALAAIDVTIRNGRPRKRLRFAKPIKEISDLLLH